MTPGGCLGLKYVHTVDLMCSCTVRSASATIMNVWGCFAAETVKSFMNSSWFISIYCSFIAAVSSHSCTTAHCSDFFPKNKMQQQSLLPVSSPFNMSSAAIPEMAGGEGREGQLFNPLQCKHDPFQWRGISQDILVWADLPKQPWHCVCPSETNLWDARAADQFEFVQKQKVKGTFFLCSVCCGVYESSTVCESVS